MLLFFLKIHIKGLCHVIAAHHRDQLVLIEVDKLVNTAQSGFLRSLIFAHQGAERHLTLALIIAVPGIAVDTVRAVFREELISGKVGDKMRSCLAYARGHHVIHLVFADQIRVAVIHGVIQIGLCALSGASPKAFVGDIVGESFRGIIRRYCQQIAVQIVVEINVVASRLNILDNRGRRRVIGLNVAVSRAERRNILHQRAFGHRRILRIADVLLQTLAECSEGAGNAEVLCAEITQLRGLLGKGIFGDQLFQLSDHRVGVRACGADGSVQLIELLLNLSAGVKDLGVCDSLTAAEYLTRSVEQFLNILVFRCGGRSAQSRQNGTVDQVIGKLFHFFCSQTRYDAADGLIIGGLRRRNNGGHNAGQDNQHRQQSRCGDKPCFFGYSP